MVMPKLSKKIASAFGVSSERGVTAIEYGLIAALIAMAIIAAVTLVGTNLGTTFNHIAANVSH
jgi:pilus assembly protein Flp/PilA